MSNTNIKRLLIMAGGTGGHIFPGLAVAEYFREQSVDVHWLGTHAGMEHEIVPKASIPFHGIHIKGLRGKGYQSLLTAPAKITQAIWQSIKHIKAIDPDIVIGMGGFVSGPGGVASWLMKRPLIIHEQNAKAGMTNKILKTFSKKVLAGFPSSFSDNTAKVVYIGNPVRKQIGALPQPLVRFTERERHQKKRLLIMGGSLGAKTLNEIVPRALASLPEDERPEILHQTGNKTFAETKDGYAALGVNASIEPFIADMAQAYAWADFVLCRAGALTVAELCTAGLGAIFVPYPYAVDDHQTANAEFMAQRDAAYIIQERDLTARQLADIVRELTRFPDKRISMAKAAYSLRKTNVVEHIFKICEEICV